MITVSNKKIIEVGIILVVIMILGTYYFKYKFTKNKVGMVESVFWDRRKQLCFIETFEGDRFRLYYNYETLIFVNHTYSFKVQYGMMYDRLLEYEEIE